MSYEPFFRNSIENEPIWFDEGPRVHVAASRSVNTSSIVTTDVDAYRQGIELTQQKHFDAGTCKIHAGTPGHVLMRNHFGMDKNFMQDPKFEELDYFDPVYYINAQHDQSPLLFSIITFPIITGDNDQLENYYYNGVIEPLPIREIASFFSTEVPFTARSIKGSFISGNEDSTRSSEQILTVDVFEPSNEQVNYLDLVDMIGGVLPLNGFFRYDKSALSPFIDTRYPRNEQIATTYSDELNSALSVMTGSTDNYINFKQKSSTSGWVYDNTSIGTDSLAFGGMTY